MALDAPPDVGTARVPYADRGYRHTRSGHSASGEGSQKLVPSTLGFATCSRNQSWAVSATNSRMRLTTYLIWHLGKIDGALGGVGTRENSWKMDSHQRGFPGNIQLGGR
jgi:hypothetical protein